MLWYIYHVLLNSWRVTFLFAYAHDDWVIANPEVLSNILYTVFFFVILIILRIVLNWHQKFRKSAIIYNTDSEVKSILYLYCKRFHTTNLWSPVNQETQTVCIEDYVSL